MMATTNNLMDLDMGDTEYMDVCRKVQKAFNRKKKAEETVTNATLKAMNQTPTNIMNQTRNSTMSNFTGGNTNID